MASVGTYDNVLGVGDVAEITGIAGGATTYRVLNIFGEVLESGEVVAGEATIVDGGPGYRLVLFESDEWHGTQGYVRDSLQLSYFRDTGTLPPLPPPGTPSSAYDPNNRGQDLHLHAFTVMGPSRWQIRNAEAPTVFVGGSDQGSTIAGIAANIAVENDAGYSSPDYADALRPRPQFVQFPATHHQVTGYAAGVTQTVAALGPGTASNVEWFEGLNEPQGQEGLTALQSAEQYRVFYAAVKAGNPDAKVMGSGEVSYAPDNSALSPQMASLRTWLANIAPAVLDGFCVHDYNAYNGDFFVTDAWIGAVRDELALAGYPDDLPFWFTETGSIGLGTWLAFDPRRAAQWTAQLLMTGERWGVVKEQNAWFYDSHLPGGPVDSWIKEQSGDLRPFATLFRVYSEEHFGRTFSATLGFGEVGDRLLRGNVCRGPGGTCVALMAQGIPEEYVTLAVSDPGPITYVDWEGRELSAPVVEGEVVLPIGELPTYVRLSEACTVDVVDAGGLTGPLTNVAPTATATVRSDALNIDRVNNGSFATGGYLPSPDQVFRSSSLPERIELEWDEPQTIGKVIIRQLAPWVNFPAGGASAMVDAALEYWNGSGWLPCPLVPSNHWSAAGEYHNETAISELAKIGSPAYRLTFYDQNWCHNIDFSIPIKTTRLRLTVSRTTAGNLPDVQSLLHAPYGLAAGGYGESLVISQIEVFTATDAVEPTYGPFPTP